MRKTPPTGGVLLIFPRGGLGRQRDLREDDGEEHQRAAEVFARGHVLVQNDRARDDGEHALKAQQDGDDRGVGVLLREDLQRVAHTAREHAHVQQRQRAREQGGGVHVLEKRDAHGRPQPREQKLHAAELHPVARCTEVVDDQNVHGKAHRAHEHEQVARGEAEAALDAQQVQGYDRQHDRDPYRQADLAPEKQAEHWHEHHVQRREKARLSGVRPGGDAGLLEVRGDGQRRAAAKAAEPELFASGAFFRLRGLRAVLMHGMQHRDEHQQREHGDEIADGVERERADRIGADVLRDEGGAPDERGQDRENDLTDLIVFHRRDPLAMSAANTKAVRLSSPDCR